MKVDKRTAEWLDPIVDEIEKTVNGRIPGILGNGKKPPKLRIEKVSDGCLKK